MHVKMEAEDNWIGHSSAHPLHF